MRTIGFILPLGCAGLLIAYIFGYWPVSKWLAVLLLASAMFGVYMRGRADELMHKWR